MTILFRKIITGSFPTLIALLMASSLHGAEVAMTEATRNVLSKHGTPQQLTAIRETLTKGGLRSLGPMPLSDEEKQWLAGPQNNVRLDPATHAKGGDGSAAKPFEHAIAGLLATKLQMPVTVVVPAGHYRELDLVVPSGVWLRADGNAVIVPPRGTDDADAVLVKLRRDSAVIGFELDGSAATRLGDAITLDKRGSHNVVIAHNRIHHIAHGAGIAGDRYSAGGKIVANEITLVGDAGIRVGSQWEVCHNIITHAGIHRIGNQGWGSDGIITGGKAKRCIIRNNLAISSKSPALSPKNMSRHAFAGQMCVDSVFEGNIGIVFGGVRGGLPLSDGCDRNRIAGNVIIARPLEGGSEVAPFGILINGAENTCRHNVVLGPECGLHVSAKPGKIRREKNVVTDNHLEARQKGINFNTAGQPAGYDPLKINTVTNNIVVLHPVAGATPKLDADRGEKQ